MRSFFTKVFDGGQQLGVRGLTRTVLGLSKENWIFNLIDGAGGAVPLILRRDPVSSVLYTDRRLEVAVLQALAATDLPVPVVLWSDLDGQHFERPAVIMRRAEGTCDYRVLNSDAPLQERVEMAKRFCHLLARVHGTDLGATGLDQILPTPPTGGASEAVDLWLSTLHERVGFPCPELESAAVWLKRRAPMNEHPALVHGDFKPGNMLLTDGHVSALLDWETAHIGDPHEDLGWITQSLRAKEHQIIGSWETPEIVEYYFAQTGRAVNMASLEWWRTFASFKSAVLQATGLQEYIDGRSDRLIREPAAHVRVLVAAMAGGSDPH